MGALASVDQYLETIIGVATGTYTTPNEYEDALNFILTAAEGCQQAIALNRTEVSIVGRRLTDLRERLERELVSRETIEQAVMGREGLQFVK